MKIYLINLDRHPQRLQRMEKLLHGLAFQRIPAVDGRAVAGPAQRDLTRPPSLENLSGCDKACTLSHRLAWQDFLAGTEKYACVLEDDIHLSPDFPRFINDESWIPKNGDLVKIETFAQKIFVSRQSVACLDRSASVLLSLHYGTAGYIVSRKGAADLLQRTAVIDLPADWIVFNEAAIQRHYPIYQLSPALCVQGINVPDGIAFAEMQTSIQTRPVKPPKSMPQRIYVEASRPIRQLSDALRRQVFQWRHQARRLTVPFA